MQVNHIKPRPLVLLADDDSWLYLMDWLRKYPVTNKLMSDRDFSMLKLAHSVEEVVRLLEVDIKRFRSEHKEGGRAKKTNDRPSDD
jgi:predicted Rossmann-fold nucleotide-binding protein